jgi:putative holliday junction resolvase
MGKIIALDFGLKRTGIAISDESKIFAFGLKTIESKKLMDFLLTLVPKEKIEVIVLGYPKKMNNEETHISSNVVMLKGEIEKNFPTTTCLLYDERFTSKMASETLYASGLSKQKRQNKALIDEVSATLILQSYLTSKSNLS